MGLTTSERRAEERRSALADERSGISIALSNVADNPVGITNTKASPRERFFISSKLSCYKLAKI